MMCNTSRILLRWPAQTQECTFVYRSLPRRLCCRQLAMVPIRVQFDLLPDGIQVYWQLQALCL